MTVPGCGVVEATHPEAMVYEVRPSGELVLVGVEYIVPGDLVGPANPPELFGHHFHENTTLGVWVLHAWIWKANPAGTLRIGTQTWAAVLERLVVQESGFLIRGVPIPWRARD
ncbi:MAG: hypothetical protein OEM39_08155 [Acidimicrobiia bacterium]|nr:hypothetical protein [Acidimicrobiia bacterium]MDH3463625.1 hypothetical protein [Acidimicrobiia bacterium]